MSLMTLIRQIPTRLFCALGMASAQKWGLTTWFFYPKPCDFFELAPATATWLRPLRQAYSVLRLHRPINDQRVVALDISAGLD